MILIEMIAKAGVTREDGKCFDEATLKMHAKESPDKYVYIEAQQELWSIKPEEEESDADIG